MGATSNRAGEHVMVGQNPAPQWRRRAGLKVNTRLSQGCRPSGK